VDDPAISQQLSGGVEGHAEGSFGPFYPLIYGPPWSFDAMANAECNASAFAGLGVIRVAASGGMGTATTPTTDALGLREAEAYAGGTVAATWRDSIVFRRKGLPPDGSKYIVHAKLALAGHWDINVGPPTGDPNDYGSGSGAEFALKIDGTGVPRGPHYNGDYYYAYSGLSGNPGEVDINIPPPHSIPLTFSVYNSDVLPTPIYFNMMILGSEQVGTGSFATYDLNLFHSLVWDGIDSVTDDTTGETVTDWTITSESGVDYSKPVRDVPEPSSLAIAGLGAFAWLLAARRRGERRFR
jgi:hypothetical protein